MYRALGQDIPAQATCPQCSYLWENSCKVCEDGDPHPGCTGCVGGRVAPHPWWKHEFFYAVASAVAISLVVSIVVPHAEKAFKKR